MVPPPPPPPPPNPGTQTVTVENGGMPDRSPPSGGLVNFVNFLVTLIHFVLGGLTFCAILFGPLVESVSFRLGVIGTHVYLCVIGYIILMSHAVLSVSWSTSVNAGRRKFIHGLMQIIGSVLVLIGGTYACIEFGDDFETPHGIVGLVAMLLTSISLVAGIVAAFLSESQKGGLVRNMHTCFACLTFIMACTAMCLGFAGDLYIEVLGEYNSRLAIAMAALSVAGTLIIVAIKLFNIGGYRNLS